MEHTKCLIIGSGPAGYTAAIYASRADLNPILYTGLVDGGQLTETTDVDNFPGYPDGITGTELMIDIRKQAERFGADIRYGYVSSVDLSAKPYVVDIDGSEPILADSIIISTGASAKWLGITSEKKYNGYGVSACAVCDGFFYRGKEVVVVGGGDTAAEEATYLSKMCTKVYMVLRGSEFRASKAMVHKVLNTENIEVLYETEVNEILGDESGVNCISLKSSMFEYDLPISGVFIAIGHKPNTDIFKGQIDMDEIGYIKTIPGTTKTNIEGVFCCGDAQDKNYRQAITAAGTGCMAAIDTERYLSH